MNTLQCMQNQPLCPCNFQHMHFTNFFFVQERVVNVCCSIGQSSFSWLCTRREEICSNASEILQSSLELTSIYLVLYLEANVAPSSLLTFRYSYKSSLLPTKTLGTSMPTSFPTILYHFYMFLKEDGSAIEKTKIMALTFLKKLLVIFRYLSCPAVSHICNLTGHWPVCNDLTLQSRPMVDVSPNEKFCQQYLFMMLVLPTEESPTMTTLYTDVGFVEFIFIHSQINLYYLLQKSKIYKHQITHQKTQLLPRKQGIRSGNVNLLLQDFVSERKLQICFNVVISDWDGKYREIQRAKEYYKQFLTTKKGENDSRFYYVSLVLLCNKHTKDRKQSQYQFTIHPFPYWLFGLSNFHYSKHGSFSTSPL